MTEEIWSDAELERLFAWFRAFRDDESRGYEKPNSPQYLLEGYAMTRVLQLIATDASRRKDTRWVPVLLEFSSEINRADPDSLQDTCNAAVQTLLANGASVTKTIRRMATSKDASVRHAIAEGLRPEDPKALPLLRVLAEDNHAEVRAPAREKVAQIEQVAYWGGLFDSDPLARLSAVERERLGPAINTIVGFANAKRTEREELEKKFLEAVDSLPDDLASEFVRRFVPTSVEQGPLLRTFVRRAIASSVLWQIFEDLQVGPDESPSEMYSLSHGLHEAMAEADASHVQALVVGWTKRLVAAEKLDGAYGTVQGILMQLMPRLWRAGMDADPLVDVLEEAVARASANADNGKVRTRLTDAMLEFIQKDTATCQRRFWQLFEVLQSFQDRDRHLPDLGRALSVEAQRVFISKFEHSEDPGLRALAMELLLTEAHDASIDPNKEQAFAVGLLDPEFRKHAFQTRRLLLEFAPQLRAALNDRALTLLESETLLGLLDDATSKEWSLLREMQAKVIAARDVRSAAGLRFARPERHWDAKDKELVEAILDWMREPGSIEAGNDTDGLRCLALTLCRQLSSSGDPSMHTLYGELITVVGDVDPRLADVMMHQYETFCEELKLPARSFDFEVPLEEEDDDDD